MWNNGFELQAMKDNDFLRAGKQMRWAKTCTNLQDHRQGQTTQVQPGEPLNWGDVAGKSDGSGQLGLTGRITERRELYSEGVSEMYTGPHSGLHLYTDQGIYVEKATRSRQWPLPRELEYRIPGVHPELGIICVPSKQSRKTHNSRGRR